MNPTVCRIHFFIYAAGSSPSVFKSKQRNRNSKKCSHSAKMPSLSGKVSALSTEEDLAFPFGEGVGFAARCCYQLKFNTAKRGFLRFKISVDISFVYIIRSYLWSSCAPLSAHTRHLLPIQPETYIFSAEWEDF